MRTKFLFFMYACGHWGRKAPPTIDQKKQIKPLGDMVIYFELFHV